MRQAPHGTLSRAARRPELPREAAQRGQPASALHDAVALEAYAHVRELPADALALLAEAEAQHVEFGADWYANLIDTVQAQAPRTTQVRIHVLRQGGQVKAVLPTLRHARRLGLEVASLSNFYAALYAPALAEGVDAQTLLPLLQGLRRERLAVYRFAPMDPGSRAFQVLRDAMAMAGLSTHAYFTFGNWYQPVSQAWPDYLQARSGQIRSALKRQGKKFAAQGGRLEIVQGGPALRPAIAAYQQVYARSWKLPEPYPAFMPELVQLCARRGWLRLGVAWLGETPVAAQIWIVANGRADIYKLAYDETHKALAPGTLLTAHLMQQAMEVDHVREIDYLIGDDPYKAAWMSHRRERFGLVAYDPLTVGGLLGLARQQIGAAWRRWQPKPARHHDNAAAA